MTKLQYAVRLAIVLAIFALNALVLVRAGHPVIGAIFMLGGLGMIYFYWWVGRDNAGWS